MNPLALEAVVFDVGNTLWFEAQAPDQDDIWRLEASEVRPLLAAWGVETPIQIEDFVRDVWRAYELAWAHEKDRGTHRDPSLPVLIRAGLAEHGITISEEQAVQWWRASWIHVRHFGVQLYPDTLDVVRAVRDMGLCTALNTNRPCTHDMLEPDLPYFGLDGLFDAIVCSGDTGFVKPHPSTFELVLARLGVRPDAALMVGDSCERDCAPAKAMGMTTVLKLNGRYDAERCEHADYTIHDLGELLTLPVFGAARHPVAAESPTPFDDNNEDRY
jgi:HAD superfamily hydrolase (TIGR01509 family)